MYTWVGYTWRTPWVLFANVNFAVQPAQIFLFNFAVLLCCSVSLFCFALQLCCSISLLNFAVQFRCSSLMFNLHGFCCFASFHIKKHQQPVNKLQKLNNLTLDTSILITFVYMINKTRFGASPPSVSSCVSVQSPRNVFNFVVQKSYWLDHSTTQILEVIFVNSNAGPNWCIC